ncbi:MAG: hypothetical protein ACLFRY_07710 [Spirochaetia bacterium]
MVFLVDFLFAAVFAVLLTLIFSTLFRRKGPWSRGLVFFLVVFLAGWAGGVWLLPFGPTLFGISWLPFLIAGLFVALILAAALPPQMPEQPSEKKIELEKGTDAVDQKRFDAFFFILIGALLIAVILGYLFSGTSS